MHARNFSAWIAATLITLNALAQTPPAPPVSPNPASPANLSSPVGLWKTIDDKTGQPRSVVRIEANGQELVGFIHQRLDPKAKPDAVCSSCPGDRLNQPIQGLNIIRGLKANPKETNTWEGGTILDPENGSDYRLRIKLIEGGHKLELRGYVGTPLLGRTQVWLRQEP
ncbi:MAG: DUF2147 domain-containing protein [Betaproteobacteria bacterium]|jgi:uncharacterized protein (DUF2147 family)|nr:DUF2147 domain-containing protein [Betaproteobacteria bacterium]